MQERVLDLGAVSLNYASGPENGPPLALFHGVTRRWQSFLPLWPALSSCWQLHAWDARGHGLSTRMPNYRVVDYVVDAVKFISETFTQPGVLYGHSLGAMVALAAAAEVPQHVRAVILEDPPFETMGERIGETPLASFFSGLAPFAGHRRDISAVARDLAEVRLSTPGKGQSVRLGDTRDATALRFTARSLMDLDPNVLRDILSGKWLAGYHLSAMLEKVNCPVLMLQADAARGAMLTDTDANLLLESLRDCTRIRFPYAPHLIHWAQTEMLLRHVVGFLEALP